MRKRHRCEYAIRLAAALVLSLTFAGGMASAGPRAEVDDPLARPEFGGDVTLKFDHVPLSQVFYSVSKISGVPFVVDFEDASTTRIDINAQHMVLRGILASLAQTNDLEYLERDGKIVVQRRGGPRSEVATTATTASAGRVATTATVARSGGTMTTVTRSGGGGTATAVARGGRPATASAASSSPTGPRYLLRLALRGADGQTRVHATGTIPVGRSMVFTQRPAGQIQVWTYDRERAVDDRVAPGLEVAIIVKNATADALELQLDVAERHVIDDTRYTEEHTLLTRSIPRDAGETSLFKAADGSEIVVSGWSVAPPGGQTRIELSK